MFTTPLLSTSHVRPAATTQFFTRMFDATFDPTCYRDHSREALQALIDAKLAHRQIAVPEPRTQEAADLEEALRVSLDQARQARTAGQRETG